MEEILPKNVVLGDIVRVIECSPFSDCTVVKIRDGFLHLFRPYVHLSDFSLGDSVIPYTGVENFVISVDSSNPLILLGHTKLQ